MRWRRWLPRLLGALVLAGALVVAGVAASVWWTARQDARPRSDVILVLGASQFDGRPSSVFEARLDHALQLYREGVAPRVVTVGGNREGDRFTEAAAGRRWLVARGVPADATIAVEQGSNTLLSLEAAQPVLAARGWRTVVLVTDPWHTFRARAMARSTGLDVAASPTRQGPAVRTRGVEVRYIARETLAYLAWRVLGRSYDKGPGAV